MDIKRQRMFHRPTCPSVIWQAASHSSLKWRGMSWSMIARLPKHRSLRPRPILQSEIERHSGAKRSGTGGLTGWQIARVPAFIDKNLHRTIYTQDLSVIARRSPADFSRSFKLTFGEPPHAYVVKRRLEKACHLMVTSLGLAERNSPECGIFGSGASLQVVSGKPLAKARPTGGANERSNRMVNPLGR